MHWTQFVFNATTKKVVAQKMYGTRMLHFTTRLEIKNDDLQGFDLTPHMRDRSLFMNPPSHTRRVKHELDTLSNYVDSLFRNTTFYSANAKRLVYDIAYLSPPMSHARKTFNLIHNTTDSHSLITLIGHYIKDDEEILPDDNKEDSCVKPDTYTHENLPKALDNMVVDRDVEKGHCIAIKHGVDSFGSVENALVRFYGACGQPDSAFKLLQTMHKRSLLAWNSVLIGYVTSRNFRWVARYLFQQVVLDGFKPDEFTLVSALTAAAHTGCHALPKVVHGYMVRSGLIKNLHAVNGLLYFHAKCGGPSKRLFDEIEARNVVSWDSMIVGAAVNKAAHKTLELFEEMEKEVVPTEITLAAVLLACSDQVRVAKGFAYFERVTEEYGIEPIVEHYACLVSSVCRKRGRLLKMVIELIEKMPPPLEPNQLMFRIMYKSFFPVYQFRKRRRRGRPLDLQVFKDALAAGKRKVVWASFELEA